MQMLDIETFLAQAGMPMHRRDMSAYDARLFNCACGRTHVFASFILDYSNHATTGANARMIVTCPSEPAYFTLIQTKYKFMVVFDRFISIAGCLLEDEANANSWQKNLIKDMHILSSIIGEITPDKARFLLSEAKDRGLTASELNKIFEDTRGVVLGNAKPAKPVYPVDFFEIKHYLLHLIGITLIDEGWTFDGEMNSEEYRFIQLIASEMTLPPSGSSLVSRSKCNTFGELV